MHPRAAPATAHTDARYARPVHEPRPSRARAIESRVGRERAEALRGVNAPPGPGPTPPMALGTAAPRRPAGHRGLPHMAPTAPPPDLAVSPGRQLRRVQVAVARGVKLRGQRGAACTPATAPRAPPSARTPDSRCRCYERRPAPPIRAHGDTATTPCGSPEPQDRRRGGPGYATGEARLPAPDLSLSSDRSAGTRRRAQTRASRSLLASAQARFPLVARSAYPPHLQPGACGHHRGVKVAVADRMKLGCQLRMRRLQGALRRDRSPRLRLDHTAACRRGLSASGLTSSTAYISEPKLSGYSALELGRFPIEVAHVPRHSILRQPIVATRG